MKRVVINKKAAAALRSFFPWVYRSDILTKDDFEPGELVEITDESGVFLGFGYINPKSVITIRVLTFKNEPINREFFKKKIQKASQKRVDIPSNAYRVVHSEADFLPGLIVDRYGDYLSVLILSYGMMRFKEDIEDILLELFAPAGMVVTTQEAMAKKEGFDYFKNIIGQVDKTVIEENGVKFEVDLLNSQKTGFFLDQRKNRKILSDYVKQKDRVLDCFSNTGGFGLYAAKLKGAYAVEVDISPQAIEQARRNFELNGVEGEFVVANVFDYLRQIRKERFDMVVLDPPSFVKSRAKKAQALKGFKDITVNGMKVVEEGGYLALFSCSHHIGMEDLKEILLKAAKDNKKVVEVVEHLYQDIDHPYILNIPNSLYLTGLLCRVGSI